MCNTVACVFSDAPLKPPKPAGDAARAGGGSAGAYAFGRGLDAAYGQFGVNAHVRAWSRSATCTSTAPPTIISAPIAVAERALGEPQSGGAVPRHADDARRLPPLALGGGAVPPARLLPGLERRARRDRHQRRARARPARSRRSTSGAWGRGIPGGDPVETLTSGAPLAKATAFAMAGIDARRRRRRRALRLLHLHRAGHARGLRLLREGRGRAVRRRRHASRPAARCRSTPAAGSSRRSTCGA